MQHAVKYTKYATHHLTLVQETYNSFFKSIDLSKIGVFSVMDIGCGSGRITCEILNPILPANCSELVAIDKDISMIEYCKSLRSDTRISFKQLDITGDLPKELERHFNYLFSAYCFHFVRDFRKALLNSHRMLKLNGELLFMFIFKQNHLYNTYRKMSNIDIWKPYTKEFANFIPHFTGTEPDSQLKNLFKEAGLKVLSHEFQHELILEVTPKQIIELYKALDEIHLKLPEDMKEQYNKDFDQLFCDETGFDFTNKQTIEDKINLPIPSVIVRAKKLGQ